MGGRRRPALTVKGQLGARWGVLAPSGAYKGVIVGVARKVTHQSEILFSFQARLVWQSVREGKEWWWAGPGVVALGVYGFAATLQPDAHFGRILAAYGGVFVAGSLAWGMIFDGFRPDRGISPAP